VKVVYIAGAFRAPTTWAVQQNVRAAEEAGLEVAKLGAMPLIPHANTAHFDGLLTEDFWLEGTAALLRRCDAVYVFNREHLDTSSGTRYEVLLAIARAIPVFKDLVTLGAWLHLPEGA
jgi:nucleoside 2-deoxyribosyltransferase